MTRCRSGLTASVVTLGMTSLVLAGTTGVARAQFVFDAVAAADGTEVTASNPSIPLGLVVTGAGPSTQARLTSLPTSDAFASFPYPGETVAGAPGIAGGVLPVPVPAYPFIVSTGLGDGPRRQTAPGVDLSTSSDRFAARSDAVVGTTTSGGESSTTVALDPDSGVTATAETIGRGLDLLNQIRVSEVDAKARAARDSSGALMRSSSLSIQRLAVPGLAIALPAQVPVFGGQTIAAPDIGLIDGSFYVSLPFAGSPQRIPVPAQSVLDALKAAGVVAEYQKPENTKDGIIGAALTLTTDLPAPPQNGTYDGPTHVTYTLGRASASVSLTPINDSPTGGSGSAPIPSSPRTVGSTPPLASGGLGTGNTPVLSGPSGSAPVTPSVSGAVPPQLSNPTSTGLFNVTAVTRVPTGARLADIYLVLAALGGLGFAAMRAIRVQGVRLS